MTSRLFIFLILVYQRAVSPWLGPHCRFFPSCSEFACEAVVTFGPFKGLGLALKRLLSCHPFHPGGHSPLEHGHG